MLQVRQRTKRATKLRQESCDTLRQVLVTIQRSVKSVQNKKKRIYSYLWDPFFISANIFERYKSSITTKTKSLDILTRIKHYYYTASYPYSIY